LRYVCVDRIIPTTVHGNDHCVLFTRGRTRTASPRA
jgi:hypothetical protein